MSVTIKPRNYADIFSAEEEKWRDIPVAIAVDIDAKACQIDRAIRPLSPPGNQPRMFGRAFTVHCFPPDFGSVLCACDMIMPGDVLVIAAGENCETAMIGEILSGHIHARGATGLICDGAVRDVAELSRMEGFSVFSRAITPRGPTGFESGAVNVPVEFGGLEINPGDIILGDDDGLARLTPKMLTDFISRAQAKQTLEREWIERFGKGDTAADIFGLTPVK